MEGVLHIIIQMMMHNCTQLLTILQPGMDRGTLLIIIIGDITLQYDTTDTDTQ